MIRICRGRAFYFTSFLIFVVTFIILNSNKNVEEDNDTRAEYWKVIKDERRIEPEVFTTQSTTSEKSEEEIFVTRRSLTLIDILRCNNVYLDTRFEYYGNFVIFHNYVRADREFKCHETITLSAPGDFRFLDNIEPLLDRWQGPISVSLYAPGDDFYSTIESIAYLRQCRSNLIREFVTFHIFFEHDHFPELKSGPLVTAYTDDYDCSLRPPYETVQDEDLYKTKHGLTYPINLARNIARINAPTHFVFPSDIELYPTRNFIPKFLNFVYKHPDLIEKGTKNVFVLPVFEVISHVPENKAELQVMLKNETAILFHKKVCALCHRVPDDKKWEAAPETEGLDVFTVGKRHDRYAVWEPFFVGTQKEPLWDTRFNWEGQSNKMVQAYHMCMLDYNFVVLDNAFLVHKPGVKKKKVQVLKHKDQIMINTHYLEELSKELPKIYGVNDHCKIRYVSLLNQNKDQPQEQVKKEKLKENAGKLEKKIVKVIDEGAVPDAREEGISKDVKNMENQNRGNEIIPDAREVEESKKVKEKQERVEIPDVGKQEKDNYNKNDMEKEVKIDKEMRDVGKEEDNNNHENEEKLVKIDGGRISDVGKEEDKNIEIDKGKNQNNDNMKINVVDERKDMVNNKEQVVEQKNQKL